MKKLLSLFIVAAACGALAASAHAQARSDYKIAPNDIIVIDVFGEKDLSKELRVTSTGKINYYLLEELEVAGKTTAELKDLLTELLNKDYLVDPKVSVDVKEYRIREVFVNGEVNKPGAIILTREQELTILGALARAGGLTVRASKKEIRFIRPGQPEKHFRFDELLRQPEKERIYLKPNDVIEVGDKLL